MTSGTVNSMHRHQRVKTEQTVLKLWKLVMTIDSNSANQVFLVAQGGPTPYYDKSKPPIIHNFCEQTHIYAAQLTLK